MRRVNLWALVYQEDSTVLISKKVDTPTCNINLNNYPLEHLKWEPSDIWEHVFAAMEDLHEIKIKLGQAKKAFMNLPKMLTNRYISFKRRTRDLDFHIEPMMTCGSEAWTINKAANNIINAGELWFLRRMQRIPYTENATNEAVLAKAGVG